MPRSFPTFDSLKQHAKDTGFREPLLCETEQQFRMALADYIQPKDMIESMEIRTGKGWDQFSPEDEAATLATLFAKKGPAV